MIINYINNLSINDINKIGINNNIYLSKEELNFTYNYIKNNYLSLIDNYKNFDFENLKEHYSLENYNKINNLITFYKKKYL